MKFFRKTEDVLKNKNECKTDEQVRLCDNRYTFLNNNTMMNQGEDDRLRFKNKIENEKIGTDYVLIQTFFK